jgi:hypothetical protein
VAVSSVEVMNRCGSRNSASIARITGLAFIRALSLELGFVLLGDTAQLEVVRVDVLRLEAINDLSEQCERGRILLCRDQAKTGEGQCDGE